MCRDNNDESAENSVVINFTNVFIVQWFILFKFSFSPVKLPFNCRFVIKFECGNDKVMCEKLDCYKKKNEWHELYLKYLSEKYDFEKKATGMLCSFSPSKPCRKCNLSISHLKKVIWSRSDIISFAKLYLTKRRTSFPQTQSQPDL